MRLSPGTPLGPYEILAPLGAGGMGEVYRAKDSRLGREVAIKVLPEAMSQDIEALARFEREAKAVAALTHPNILAIFDIGYEKGVAYAVMELLEGETLRARLLAGVLAPRGALDYARQVAEGLAAAHDKGIIHRDLKPENLFITSDNRVKILDFGLAKLQSVAPVVSQGTTPTGSIGTDRGVTLGSVGYMSPEQVRGEPADHRSDIFSFGAVVYEMASGRRAFKADSAVETLTAILKEEPPEPDRTLTGIGLGLERIIRHCLEKNPGARYQSARDLSFQLSTMSDFSVTAAAAVRIKAESRWRHWSVRTAGAAVGLALAAAGFVLIAARRPVQFRSVLRSFIPPPDSARFNFFTDVGGPVVISPDERALAFVATDEAGISSLWVRPVDQLAARVLPGTEGASFPFWSADSRMLGFFTGGKLKRVDLNGGAATVVCDAPQGRGGSWSTKGMILFVPDIRAGLSLVPADGGAPKTVTKLDPAHHTSHLWPLFMPDGNHYLYLAINHDTAKAGENGLYFASLKDGEPRLVMATGSNVSFAAGRLLFLREGTLVAQDFNPVKGVLRGDTAPVGEKIQYDPTLWRGAFDARGDAVLVFRSGSSVSESNLTWFDRTGKPLETINEKDRYYDMRLSPDGGSLAASINDPADLWVINLARGTKSRLTFEPGPDNHPLWSADGMQVIYTSVDPATGRGSIIRRPADGSGVKEVLSASSQSALALQISPDGRTLIYAEGNFPIGTKSDLWALPLFEGGKPFVLLNTPFAESDAQLSPDGRWLAYVSDASERPEVYVVPFNPADPDHPVAGGKWQISVLGGSQPRWRGDGRELFFKGLDGRLKAAALTEKTGTFEPETPRPLFTAEITTKGWAWDVTADGERFLIASSDDKESTPLTLVTNWDAELKP